MTRIPKSTQKIVYFPTNCMHCCNNFFNFFKSEIPFYVPAIILVAFIFLVYDFFFQNTYLRKTQLQLQPIARVTAHPPMKNLNLRVKIRDQYQSIAFFCPKKKCHQGVRELVNNCSPGVLLMKLASMTPNCPVTRYSLCSSDSA